MREFNNRHTPSTRKDVMCELRSHLVTGRWGFADGEDVFASSGLTREALESFAASWDGLTLDRYMGDNGGYRFRRYGEFELAHPGALLRQLPHGPYEQPNTINPLNGGIPRFFDPLEERFVTHPFLDWLLRSLAVLFEQAQGYSTGWNIRLHPYRIRASPHEMGKPTPEGLHRDGVDFITTLMINRVQVSGGVTTVTDPQGTVLHRLTLLKPLDLLVADDARTLHEVSPVLGVDSQTDSYRDVLVVAFTRTHTSEVPS